MLEIAAAAEDGLTPDALDASANNISSDPCAAAGGSAGGLEACTV